MPRQTERPEMVHRNHDMAYRLAAAVAERPGASPAAAIQAAGLFAVAAAFGDIAVAIREAINYAKEEDQRYAALQKSAA